MYKRYDCGVTVESVTCIITNEWNPNSPSDDSALSTAVG